MARKVDEPIRADGRPGRLAAGSPGTAHKCFPVIDGQNGLVGVAGRSDVLDAAADATVATLMRQPPAVAFEDSTLREAADLMVHAGVGRLAVVRRGQPARLTGIVTRSDLLSAHGLRLEAARRAERTYGRPDPRAPSTGRSKLDSGSSLSLRMSRAS